MGIVIGQTKDDITGMILEIYWKCGAASSGIVAWWLIYMRFCIPHLYMYMLYETFKFDKTFKLDLV